MRSRFGRLIVFFCLMVLAVFSLASLAQGQNLFPNGGFEKGDTSGWMISNPKNHPLKVNLTTQTTQVHGGKFALAVNAFDGGKDELKLINAASVADLPAGTLLHARLFIKSHDLTMATRDAGISLWVAVNDKAGNQLLSPGNANFVDSFPYTPVDVLFSLPPESDSVGLYLTIGAGIKTGSILVDDASLEVVKNPGSLRTDTPLAQLRKDSGGTPRLWINGKVRTPGIFFGNTGGRIISDEITKAGKAGVDLVQICMNLPWTGSSTGNIEQAVHANPKALIIPRIFMHPPATWLKQHPDQVILNEEHKSSKANFYASMASDMFFDEAKQQIELFVRFIQNSPVRDRVIGYHLEYLAECFFYYEMDTHFVDYSEVNRQKFTKWLAAKYGNVGELNKAWNKQYVSFADAQIPPAADWRVGDDGIFRDPANPRAVAVADFQMYFNNLTAERLIEMAELIKKLTANRSLVVYFYGMQNEFVINGDHNGIGHSGHLGTRRVLASPAIDFICAPISYHGRAPGEPFNMMGIVDSVTLAGKIYLEEDDSRTYLWKNPPATPYWALNTEWDTLQCLRRNFGNVIAHNQAIWWMDLCANGSYNGQSIWDGNRKLMETYTDSIEKSIPTRPEVALVYDEGTFFWLKSDSSCLNYSNLSCQRYVFQSIGAQVGYYYIEDLQKIPDSAKVIVFVSTIQMDKKKEALVNSMKGKGRTLVWLYAPGYVGAKDLSKKRVERITGFQLEKSDVAILPEIQITSSPMTQSLNGHKFGVMKIDTPAEPGKPNSSFSPTFSGAASDKDAVVWGTYAANGKPALLFKKQKNWTSIFCGAPMLSVPVLRSICRQAGVALLVDPDDLNTEDSISFNGRYLYVYARTHDGPRTFQVPGGPRNVMEVVSGKKIAQNVSQWTDSFKMNEQKIYQLLPVSGAAKNGGTSMGISANAKDDIILNGCAIITDSDQPSYVQHGVKELHRYLEDLAAGKIAMRSSPSPDAKVQIVVGRESIERLFSNSIKVETEELGEEGYLIKTLPLGDGIAVIVTGATPKGTKQGLVNLMKQIQVQKGNVFIREIPRYVSKPSFHIRGMHLNGWAFKYPYSFRPWSEEDWKRYIDIIAYQGVNLFFIWPFMEIMPLPLSSEDESYLREVRRVVEYAQKQHGMEVWIFQSANRIAVSDLGERNPRLRPYWVPKAQGEFTGPGQIDLNPAEPGNFARIMKSREALYKIVNNADGYCTIDSDPGGWVGSPASQLMDILKASRALIDKHCIKGKRTKLIQWLWAGWGQEGWWAHDWSQEHQNAYMGKMIQTMKRDLPEPWWLIAGRQEYLPACAAEGVLPKTVYLPYNIVEGEPSRPGTQHNFTPIRNHLDVAAQYPQLAGIMGNTQTPLLQFPHVHYFLSSAWDYEYRQQDLRKALLELAKQIYPEQAELLTDGWMALQPGERKQIGETAGNLERWAMKEDPGRMGVLGRKLFPRPVQMAQDLVWQLKAIAAFEALRLKATPDTPPEVCAGLIEKYLDAALTWDEKPGWSAYWRKQGRAWDVLPVWEPAYPEVLSNLKKILGGADEKKVSDFLAPIQRRLAARHDAWIVDQCAIQPLKEAILKAR